MYVLIGRPVINQNTQVRLQYSQVICYGYSNVYFASAKLCRPASSGPDTARSIGPLGNSKLEKGVSAPNTWIVILQTMAYSRGPSPHAVFSPATKAAVLIPRQP